MVTYSSSAMYQLYQRPL